MRHFASSHLQPFALSPTHLALPVGRVSSVPSFTCAPWFAAACAPWWRLLPGAPVEAAEFVAASRGTASANVVCHGSVVPFGRPLLLRRLARVTQVRRVPSSAHRGRRIASADSCATRVVCGGRAFVSRFRSTPSALALAPMVPASPVSRSAPTRRSTPFPSVTGRCAMKPRSAGHLQRWGAQGMRQFAPSHLQPLALSPMRLVLPVRKVSALPSFANTRRFAAACASFWHLLRVAPIECPVQVRASRGHTSACVLGRGSVASVGRPLLLGRLAGVT